jgi:DNA-binding response OmpR family regulator
MAKNKKAKKIFILEDDSFSIKIYTSRLTKAGYEVATTSTADEVIRLAEDFDPDLFMLDIMVQTGNGFDVIQSLRKHKKFKKTPIITLSNLGDENDIARATKLGANKYFVKSNTRFAEVIEKIDTLMKK